ncbi:MAG: Mut7-C ubiquitin/RNAse domain-containing protein [Proteobacteria bacterium]|nr:Mut7-C ubiquitin/RNAse domain-containing protein [Pseudomonadota bacterium]MBU4297665.1 Mut7-C ubiquitin/RNAse domain-containing protein [Pseudomonadota bacterium]MCG2748378.1 Mut7-C ubiquitin/RNAse domain-containing protein [Desulfobulbaceae bacterium]
MITVNFHGNIAELLSRKSEKGPLVSFHLDRRTSIKDLIESFGIPHPEIEEIVVDGKTVDFAYIVDDGIQIEVFPISVKSNFFKPSLLRPDPLEFHRFVVDINVAKLASKLRQLGFDTLLPRNCDDAQLAAIAGCQRRILLTRDCNLLKRKIVEFGHLVRAESPNDQLVEIIKLYNLKNKIKPYSRCFQCNGLLESVAKEAVLPFLEPLTKKYYHVFHRCLDCKKIYWFGSHREKMDVTLHEILASC